MILYTTVPQEAIFPEENTHAKQMTLDINEGQLIVEQVSDHELRVVRLISSDPFAYLNESYTPGKMISLL
ncbi:hypothetical protein BKP35_15885 [Anaerobacillus arseniciselenatis]|uniref:Uncharacterized protein n=1 Tax=Anaerobacillus arseniciselenatis TaxID=85682 RepID=A0A1S2LCH4_9BACI|nr:YlzJ-like family protein [Anaerobacillus arseniciselenatis]OIJ09960.1 hypothetical protein BKP35_15885 [Anaerobacillus arseniciselenatis]